MNYQETEELIEFVLTAKRQTVWERLNDRIVQSERSIPEFYEGVLKHGPKMSYTNDQWFDFLRKIPLWRLLEDKGLMDKLSPNQREQLLNEITS